MSLPVPGPYSLFTPLKLAVRGLVTSPLSPLAAGSRAWGWRFGGRHGTLSAAGGATVAGPNPAAVGRREPALAAESEDGEDSLNLWPFLTRHTLLFGALGVLLAAAGEALVAAKNTSSLSLVLYLGGIALFAWSAGEHAPRLQPAQGAGGSRGSARRWRYWLVLVGGTSLAVALGLVNLRLLKNDIRDAAGVPLWLGSMAILLATGIAVRREEGWPAVWSGRPGWRRPWVLGAIFAILVIAAAARLLLLDRIPLGINADEGDRAASAMQIIRGTTSAGIFEVGWYHISMVYFWILAQLLKVLGIGYTQARVLGALTGLAAAGLVMWIGLHHFGTRIGLLAGGLVAVLAVALQFSRETTEASPTAALWALSTLLLLEGARRGRSWAWIGAGLAGGLGLYFYPSARLWAVLAGGACLYLFIHGLWGRRLALLRGIALAALAAALAAAPFLLMATERKILTVRAEEVSIFTRDNVTRLNYYRPEWSTTRLVWEQTIRSVGLINQFSDQGGFWPTERPLMPGALAVLTFLGLGWCCLRWRDPRFVITAIWYLSGLVGVIVTVETPNLQRLAAAVPVLAIPPALVLDSLARRAAPLFESGGAVARAPRWLPSAAAAAVAGWLIWGQASFYFGDYAAMERWPVPNMQGQAMREQGPDTLVLGLSSEMHMTTSGWIRLLAPDTPGGGVRAPGSSLPVALPADQDLAFMLFPKQRPYLPYLQAIYPDGALIPYVHPKDGPQFVVYRVPRETLESLQGALAIGPNDEAARVASIGQPPAGWRSYPSAMRWIAGLRAPRFWNYLFEVGPGPARLVVDGKELLAVPAGVERQEVAVSLVQGAHSVEYEATLSGPDGPAGFRWAEQPERRDGSSPRPDWQAPSAEQLLAGQDAPQGLLAVTRVQNRAEQRRLDPTLATCCLGEQVRANGSRYSATWSGVLTAPTAGEYGMSLLADGQAELRIDGRTVVRQTNPSDRPVRGRVTLSGGPQRVELTFQDVGGRGNLEWTWTPPDGIESIVPPRFLAPPGDSVIGPRLLPNVLGPRDQQPTPLSLYSVR
jgi:hypothetical protein